MNHLSTWLRPPRFEDEEKTREAFLLHVILWALIAVPILFLAYTLLFSQETKGRALTQALCGVVVNAFLLALLRRGHVRTASIIQIVSFWIFFTGTALTGAGVHSQAYQIGYALVISIAGFLIGMRGALTMVGVSLLSGGLMAMAGNMGLWSFKPPDKALNIWAVSAVLFPVLVVLQYLAGRLLRTSLAQSRRSQAQYQNLVGHLPQRIFIKDVNSGYVSCNANFARDLGMEPEQIVGKNDFAFFSRETAERHRADDREVIAGEVVKETEEEYVLSGKEGWIHTIRVPYRDEQGRVVGVLGIFADITERKRTEQSIWESELVQRTLMEGFPVGLIVVDAQTRQIERVNPAAAALFGAPPPRLWAIDAIDSCARRKRAHARSVTWGRRWTVPSDSRCGLTVTIPNPEVGQEGVDRGAGEGVGVYCRHRRAQGGRRESQKERRER